MVPPASSGHLLPMTEPLHIYLNDHLAGATGGLELFRRAASSASGERRVQLDRLAEEVAQDREALLAIMAALDVPVRHYKVVAGWLAEKVGRAKPNGHLLTRAPLSDLVESEAMLLGVRGKAAGWQALRTIAEHDGRLDAEQLDRLVTRADEQSAVLESLRRESAVAVFG
jgi:hypothetical protein